MFPKPRIGLIVTGSELVPAGQGLKPGQIYESNSATIDAAIKSSGFTLEQIAVVEDNLEKTTEEIQDMMNQLDVVILSGGISVGDYDFVGKAMKILEVKELFYKVNQKPGKPIFFGKTPSTLLFALPGNPSASLLCYYEYVLPALGKMSGFASGLKKINTILKGSYLKRGSRAHFLKANVNNNITEILEGQSSAMLHTFATANALAYVPANKSELKEGDEIEVHILP